MPNHIYRLIDKNTGEEVYPSDGFSFADVPLPQHRIHDADLRERYGAPAVVNKVEETTLSDGTIEVRVYIDGVEERLSGDDTDESYRRS